MYYRRGQGTAEHIEVLISKTFPSGAKLTKVKVLGRIAYVRENAWLTDLGTTGQVLELCVPNAPDEVWSDIEKVVHLEDDLRRYVYTPSYFARLSGRPSDFTPEWAEAALKEGRQE